MNTARAGGPDERNFPALELGHPSRDCIPAMIFGGFPSSRRYSCLDSGGHVVRTLAPRGHIRRTGVTRRGRADANDRGVRPVLPARRRDDRLFIGTTAGIAVALLPQNTMTVSVAPLNSTVWPVSGPGDGVCGRGARARVRRNRVRYPRPETDGRTRVAFNIGRAASIR